jgi:ribonuclease BN (tRNA processing enzyme)
MSELGLLTLGVGDAFSARHYSSCFALVLGDRWLLIDCPHPIRKMLREAGAAAVHPLDLDALAGVVVTHLHADHCSGLEGLGFYSRFVRGRRVRLLAHPRVFERLWHAHLAAGMQFSDQGGDGGVVERRLEDFFDWTPLDEAQAAGCEGFRVRCRFTRHSVPTTALIVEAGGLSVGYSADTAFEPTLVQWLSGADLVVHEAGRGDMHTPYERLCELPPDARRRLRLIHCPDDFDVTTSALEALRQGCFYRIEADAR